ncbi:unnamed protein product [Effrenium voratum]|uniref:Uncharacterized protein n=1 Tax=Effrenium voratum TaxID=2562239 RepID=A0AA36IVN3_9DINO|nr:unnamed protein product [Effrenium voratum]
MGIPDDATEAVRKKSSKKEEQEKEDALIVDGKQVHGMTPELRLKWLDKALQRCEEGKVEKSLIFDILSNAKFCHDCSSKMGAKMFRLVRAHADSFSAKQRKHLQVGDCLLRKLYKKATSEGEDDKEDKDTGAGAMGALWDRLTALAPAERAEQVEALNDATKEALEEFLEARDCLMRPDPGCRRLDIGAFIPTASSGCGCQQ